MGLRFADIPATDERLTRSRTRQPAASRRTVLGTGFAIATAAAFGVLEAVNRGVARAVYFQEVVGVQSGPCAPGNYASNHTESGIPCGPSLRCSACCWSGSDSGDNRFAWHRVGEVAPVEYFQRPDECWSGVYDAWRWNFTGGRTYRCSDGYRYTNSTGTVKTICPWGF